MQATLAILMAVALFIAAVALNAVIGGTILWALALLILPAFGVAVPAWVVFCGIWLAISFVIGVCK